MREESIEFSFSRNLQKMGKAKMLDPWQGEEPMGVLDPIKATPEVETPEVSF